MGASGNQKMNPVLGETEPNIEIAGKIAELKIMVTEKVIMEIIPGHKL